MTRKLEQLAAKAERLESVIANGVTRATRAFAPATARQPLELVHAVIDSIEGEVQPVGRGRRAFPFTCIQVAFAAATPREQARLQVACEGPPALRQRLEERLLESGCTVSELMVEVTFVEAPGETWQQPEFDIEYSRGTRAGALAPAPAPRLDLIAVSGTTHVPPPASSGRTITIGRGSEVRDKRQRLIRTNHVAFVDGDSDVTQSVSRRHARIDFDAAAGVYRLHDESGRGGTTVVRDGLGLDVPRGRGLRLRSGDVIVLGQAQLRVRIEDVSVQALTDITATESP